MDNLVKFLRNIHGTDLATVTSPPFFLAPISAVEAASCWTERPSLFSAPALEFSAEKRSLLVLKWIICSLQKQFYIGSVGDGIKKPLNPFLGELFIASWTDGDATANLVTEQVSHHPSITAVYFWDEKHGIRAHAYSRVQMVFNSGMGSGEAAGLGIDVRQSGHGIVHFDKFGEDYLIPAPRARVKGFLSGSLYPELVGTSHIVSSSGFVSEIRFSPPADGNGLLNWLRGGKYQRNRFEAVMYRRDDPNKTPLYSASGQWSKSFEILDCQTGSILETHDQIRKILECPPLPAKSADPENQDPWETRRAWAPVVKGLRKGDLWETSQQKTRLENAQREMRAEESRNGSTWEPLFFKQLQGGYDVFEKLGSATAWPLEKDRTKGVWVADEERIRKLTRPFRGNLTPYGSKS